MPEYSNEDTRAGAGQSLAAGIVNGKAILKSAAPCTLTLKRNYTQAAAIDSPVAYRYGSDEKLGRTFLLASDPNITGLAESLVVDQILQQLENEGHAVERGADQIRISMHP